MTRFAYTARAMPLRALATIAAAATAPAVLAEAKGGAALPLAMTTGTVIAASAAGYAVQDAAGETLAASPTTLTVRRGIRLGVALGVASMGWMVLGAIALITDDAAVLTAARAVAAAAVAAVALAVGAAVQERRGSHPGYVGSLGAVGLAFASTALANLYTWPPSLTDDASLRRWAVVSVIAAGTVAMTCRDPAARPRFVRDLRQP